MGITLCCSTTFAMVTRLVFFTILPTLWINTICEMQKDSQRDHALHQGLMVLVYKMLKGKIIEKPISKGKKIRDDDTESENSGLNLYSETEGESEDFSNKGKTKGKRKRTDVDSYLLDYEDESFDDKIIKIKKRKGMGKQTQRMKKISKGINKVKRKIIISPDENSEVEKIDNNKGKDEDEMLDGDHGENLNIQRIQNEGQENNMGNQNICHGAIGNDNIKGLCEVINKLVKEIGDLKTDLNMIKKATMGEKPLSENVKELMVAINKAEAIEAMVSKIMEMEKKVKELEGIKDDKGLETNLNNLANRVDKMELTVKRIAEKNFQILKATVDHVKMLINKFE